MPSPIKAYPAFRKPCYRLCDAVAAHAGHHSLSDGRVEHGGMRYVTRRNIDSATWGPKRRLTPGVSRKATTKNLGQPGGHVQPIGRQRQVAACFCARGQWQKPDPENLAEFEYDLRYGHHDERRCDCQRWFEHGQQPSAPARGVHPRASGLLGSTPLARLRLSWSMSPAVQARYMSIVGAVP